MCNCDISILKGDTEAKGDTGLQGPAGVQGIQGTTGATGAGTAGVDGEKTFVYIAYANDNIGTGFTNTFNPSLDYIAIKSTTTQIVSPIVSDFTGLWKNYKGAQGNAGINGTNGANGINGTLILSGGEGPTGVPVSTPAFYINYETYDIYQYSGGWSKVVQGYGDWLTPTYTGSWVDSGDVDYLLRFRKEGKTIRMSGSFCYSTPPTSLITSVNIFTLPFGYRNTHTGSMFFQGLNMSTFSETPIIEVRSDGLVKARGDISNPAFTTSNNYFNITWETD